MTSTNWQRVTQDYEGLPTLLRTASPAFVASEEAATLAAEDWALPGVVLAAWGRFLSRTFSEERRGQLSVAERAVVESQFDLLERLCSSEDPEVVNAVAVEIFEHLQEGDEWHRDFARRLGPRARWEYGLATKPDAI
jgi:hypothetical protein